MECTGSDYLKKVSATAARASKAAANAYQRLEDQAADQPASGAAGAAGAAIAAGRSWRQAATEPGRLRGKSESGALLASVPGIGKSLAARLHRELGIDTLEELESAAHDGRLEAVTGIGNKRVAGIIDSLAARLGRVRPIRPVRKATDATVAEILDVDQEYRVKAAAGALPTIAPHRFNPDAGGMAADPAFKQRRTSLHGDVFEHRCAPTKWAEPETG